MALSPENTFDAGSLPDPIAMRCTTQAGISAGAGILHDKLFQRLFIFLVSKQATMNSDYVNFLTVKAAVPVVNYNSPRMIDEIVSIKTEVIVKPFR